MTGFSTYFIDEPDLIFGGQKEEKDPRIGLRYHGPYHYSTEDQPSPSQVRVGIIGNSITIELTSQLLEKLGTSIKSPETNKWLYPDYPGFSSKTSIKCDFITSPSWNERLKDKEVDEILLIADANRRIAAGVNLFVGKVHSLSMEDNKPDVIICALPQLIEEYCGISERTRGAKRPRFTEIELLVAQGQMLIDHWGLDVEEKNTRLESDEFGLDFHNALKGRAMEFGIPVQIVRESTCRGFLFYGEKGVKTTQEPATVAWNLSTALYYKSNGKPWRLAKLRQDTCYVGISFFHDLRNPDTDVQTSMAQVFTHNGEGIVLRGKEVVVDEMTKQPHMTTKQATELLAEALRTYRLRSSREPARVVIHKTSMFSKEEEQGCKEAIQDAARDFVTISDRHSYRFARVGHYPVLRGTLIRLSENRALLYTNGYIPRVRTYPGPRIPQPLLITHHGDSQMIEMCKEIMGLTKLNWNTTAFATELPITLEFARKVGNILSELPEGRVLQNHYRFYM